MIQTTVMMVLLPLIWVSVAQAGEFFRWVDDHGITHYGEVPPEGTDAVRAFSTPNTQSESSPEQVYFSIVNQSRRMEEARLARERIRVDQELLARDDRPEAPRTPDDDYDNPPNYPYGYQVPYLRHDVRIHRPPPHREFVTPDCRTSYIGCKKSIEQHPRIAGDRRTLGERRRDAARPDHAHR